MTGPKCRTFTKQRRATGEQPRCPQWPRNTHARLPGVESSWEVRPEGLEPRSSNFHMSWRELLASDEDL